MIALKYCLISHSLALIDRYTKIIKFIKEKNYRQIDFK